MNRVCEILGIEKPVVQAPMAWITSPELVAAVSNAGGLGILGTSAGSTEIVTTVEETVEEMRKAIRRTRELTDKPFGINVFPSDMDPYGFSKAMIALAKEEGVKVLVAVGSIAPDEYRQWKKDGFIIIARESNPSVRGAIEAEKGGADIIVATGCDKRGDMNPPQGSFFYGMYKGDLDAGVNTVNNLTGLIKSIDACEDIVNELAAPFAE